MKTKLFFAAGMLIAAIATGQNRELKSIEVAPPKFKTSAPESVEEFIKANVGYPAETYKWRMEGTEVVQFVVTSEGEIKDFKVINSVSREIDNEVIRLLMLTDKMWIPGTKNGEPVSMEKEVTLAFQLSPASDFVENAKFYMTKANELCFQKNKPEKALRFYDMAVNYLPNEEAIISIRGLCKYMMGNINEADKDWKRAEILAQRNDESTDNDNLAINSEYLKRAKQLMNNVEK
jgi:tetratricopeptide (TPR) repeat protein